MSPGWKPRQEADALVRQLVARYADDLDKRPVGRHFRDVYNVERVEPRQEWLDMVHEVKDELREMGLLL